MKRLLTTTTALSVALAFTPPMPLRAQSLAEDGKVVAADGTVLCDPATAGVCDLEAIKAEAAAAVAQAEADAAAAAQAEAAAAAAAQAEADAAAAAQAEADAAAAAQAEADAAAQAEADAAAAAQAEADAAADADAAAAAQAEAAAAAAAQAEAAAAAAAQADADAAVAAQAEADAAAQAEADAAAAAQAEADAAADADAAAAAQAEADAAAAALAASDAASAAAAQAAADAAAVLATETVPDVPVETLAPAETAVLGLTTALQEPAATEGATELAAPIAEAAAASAAPPPDGTQPSDIAAPSDAVVTTQTISDADARSSSEEFTEAPVAVGDGKKSGLSDLEKVGLVALGALVVGAVINENNKKNRQEVVSNSGDRVVVKRPDGTYQIYKDDDAILRRPGSKVRTETYNDGSTRTIVQRDNGTQIVTVRDASGRVLRRANYDSAGRELVLFDDLQPERPIIVTDLPRARPGRLTILTNDENAALKARLAAREAAEIGRSFSLRQIREIAPVRDLAATIDVDSITFDSGSSAIKASEAEKLADLGGLITELIDANPGEVFLIEGHTDAVGGGGANLALSDRRAESVALALTEYFDVPPENLLVQGYGEKELRIDTQGDERANRRVAVRIITPLLSVASK